MVWILIKREVNHRIQADVNPSERRTRALQRAFLDPVSPLIRRCAKHATLTIDGFTDGGNAPYADDFVPSEHKTKCIEIGGVHERRRSNRAVVRGSLTFWPLLQQSHP